MDKDERLVLGILVNTNKTLFEAKKSNKHRLNNFGDITESRYKRLEDISVKSLDNPLTKLHNEIINVLNFSPEYIDFLSRMKELNIYDCAELITEIGDITRFKNKKHFISYAGLAPVVKKNNRICMRVNQYNTKTNEVVANSKSDNIDYCEDLKQIIMKCTKKLINHNNYYRNMYFDYKRKYQKKHPLYDDKRLHLMALKKVSIKFANRIYYHFHIYMEES